MATSRCGSRGGAGIHRRDPVRGPSAKVMRIGAEGSDRNCKYALAGSRGGDRRRILGRDGAHAASDSRSRADPAEGSLLAPRLRMPVRCILASFIQSALVSIFLVLPSRTSHGLRPRPSNRRRAGVRPRPWMWGGTALVASLLAMTSCNRGSGVGGGSAPSASSASAAAGARASSSGGTAAAGPMSCAGTKACEYEGQCQPAKGGQGCEPGSDADCRAAQVCKDWGLCGLGAGHCAASSDEDCRSSYSCKVTGRCTAQDGKCAAVNDSDCRRSELCKYEHKCTADGGWCKTHVGEKAQQPKGEQEEE